MFHLFSMEVTFAPPRQNEGNFACDILSFEGVPLIAALRVTCSPSALWVGVRRLHFITLSDGCPSVCSDNWSAAGDKQADLGKGRTRGVKAACPEFTQPVHHSTCVSFYGALESRPTHTRDCSLSDRLGSARRRPTATTKNSHSAHGDVIRHTAAQRSRAAAHLPPSQRDRMEIRVQRSAKRRGCLLS